jgi:hypothetical protein
MGPHRFDGLTTRFLPSGTRRDLGTFAAMTLLGLMAFPAEAPSPATAGKRKKRKRRCGARARRRLCRQRCGKQTLCGKRVNCKPCCTTSADCVAAGTGDICCDSECVTGVCCSATDCANPTPACIDLACAPCTATDQCINGQVCEVGGVCCDPEGTPCTDFTDCCSQTCDNLVGGGTCAPCRGRACDATQPCCGGLVCTGGFCGGCRDRARSCTSASQCCFSDCTGGACLSTLGGRCARDVDCRTCYLEGNCTGACVGGVCTI